MAGEIIAVAISVLAGLLVRKGKTKNESILSLHFLEDTLLVGWPVILMAIILRFTDWYILDPAFIDGYFYLYSVESHSRFWSALKIFLDAVPESRQVIWRKDLEALPNVNSVNQPSIWSMDGLENNAIVHICIKVWEQMMETKEVVRQCLKERGVQNITIEVDSSQSNHAQHRRRVRTIEQKHGHHH